MPIVNVATAAQFVEAFNTRGTSSDTYVTVNITDDIDFNEDPYYKNKENFINTTFATSENLQKFIVNGNGHTISNIYIHPTKKFIGITNNVDAVIEFNNCKFEFISNNAQVIYIKSSYAVTYFNNCMFNGRLYNLDASTTFWSGGIMPFHIDANVEFTNCCFNLFITSVIGNSPNYASCFALGGNSNEFESCIFKIRNNTNKYISFFENSTSSRDNLFENCAFFYNDTGTTKPNYTYNIRERQAQNLCYGSDGCTINNTYFAAFGEPDNTPIIYIGKYSNPDSRVLSSFYDKNKLIILGTNNNNAYNYQVPHDQLNIGMMNLTTTECKSPAKLSEIGYIFCEEV